MMVKNRHIIMIFTLIGVMASLAQLNEEPDLDSLLPVAVSEAELENDSKIGSEEFFKRKFTPWGGKRSIPFDEIVFQKRQFTPWGGKRTMKALSDRRGFTPWGGKRNFSNWNRKRNFNPWGGKRNMMVKNRHIIMIFTLIGVMASLAQLNEEPDLDSLLPVAVSEAELENDSKIGSEEFFKRKFTPWGGKRSIPFDEIVFQKRQFTPWGGKRTMKALSDRRGFTPWGGKRNFSNWNRKRNFNPWGGKRNEFSSE
ncbi:uncharacterized protein LOC111641577 [Centruroides sculpturatus]|uniref:uncharacterized protein LOC111641577 n=1 Tax=Centruroides sculpturatus TaxID=218467 RepID=UPI000C6D2F98|nr:uncharacterized protein LOC111641577 [Centruroides sculpturatus]